MDKIRTVLICLLIPFFILTILFILRTKHKEEFRQKVVLAQEIRKVLDHLMLDLRQAHENTLLDDPADGQWHKRIAFIPAGQGILEYMLKDKQLLRIKNGKESLIADDIADLRIRRQKENPDILEIEIKAQNKATLISYLKMRVRE